MNATIQELIPARRRGFTDLVVNGSFWLGAAIGALGALLVLNPGDPGDYGWRFAFIISAVLSVSSCSCCADIYRRARAGS